MNVQHNMNAAAANRYLNINQKELQTSAERLSSGYRINSAADDAAGLTISEKMRWQVRGLNRASDNIGEGISLTQVADGALQEVHSMLQRMVELTVQAANDTNTEEDRIAIQREINEIKTEINRISTDTEYNTLKIFKSTTAPKLSGNPTDVLVYWSENNAPGGTKRADGIIYKGKRYAYEKMGLNFDANGNIIAGTYPVEVEGADGKPLKIDLIFDGGNRIPSGRHYELMPDTNGVSIDRINYPWSSIKKVDEPNVSIQTSGPNKGGEYYFVHAGMRVSFEVEDGAELPTIIDSLLKDGMDTYELRSEGVTQPAQPVNPFLDMKRQPNNVDYITVTSAIMKYIPKDKNSNLAPYKIKADVNQIELVVPADHSISGKEVSVGVWQWDQIVPPLPDSKWKDQGGLNPDSTVDKEALKEYTFSDVNIGSIIKFKVDSEASKNDLINAMNDWEIKVQMNTSMNFSCNPPSGSTVKMSVSGPVSWNLYDKQIEMGLIDSAARPRSLPVTNGIDASGKFTLTVEDGKKNPHVFTATMDQNTLKAQIINNFGLNNRINNIARAKLLYGDSYTPTQTYERSLSFVDNSKRETITLNAEEDTTNWFRDPDMFQAVRDPKTGQIRYEFNESKRKDLEQKVEDMANRMVAAFQNPDLKIEASVTDAGSSSNPNNEVRATMSINSPTSIPNVRYSSTYTPSNRELKIQSSARGGDYIAIKLHAMDTGILKVETVDVTSHDAASASLDKIYGAIDHVSEIRTDFGVTQNRLEHAMSVDDIMAENVQASESLLRDADMADESVSNALHNILMQSGQSMLAQANQEPQNVMKLFS